MTATERAKRDRQNEATRRRYAERVAAGECCRCRRPVTTDSLAYCGEHLVQMRKRVKRKLLAKLVTTEGQP